MRAIQMQAFGGPEVLELVDLPVPEPAAGEVLVKVSRAGLNYADTHQRTNSYLAKATLPLIPGSEVAGVREDTGERVVALCGAGVAVDASPDGLADRLVEANLGERVDAVFEMAGGQVFDECLKALAPFGRCVTYGIASEEANTVQTGALMRRSHAVVGFWLMHCIGRPAMIDEALADLFARVAAGELRVIVGGTYPLADAAHAQVDLRERRTTGKVLLDPSA